MTGGPCRERVVFGKILVCLDGTEFSEQILPCAMAEARKQGSGIILLHVSTRDIPAGAVPISGQASFFPFELFAREIVERDSLAISYLQRIANEVMTQGVDVECVVLPGWTADLCDLIIRYSLDSGVDLIAMATHGRTGWRRLLWGSVTDSVTRRSSVAVMVISPGNVQAGDRQWIGTTDNPMRPSVG
jgi:nucleotide-binding universal stress UspA family protein